MLVEAVHVQPAHGRINDSVYLKNKIFTFRVAEKLEKEIQKGMLVYSKDGQLVYVKNIITGRSEEEGWFPAPDTPWDEPALQGFTKTG